MNGQFNSIPSMTEWMAPECYEIPCTCGACVPGDLLGVEVCYEVPQTIFQIGPSKSRAIRHMYGHIFKLYHMYSDL